MFLQGGDAIDGAGKLLTVVFKSTRVRRNGCFIVAITFGTKESHSINKRLSQEYKKLLTIIIWFTNRRHWCQVNRLIVLKSTFFIQLIFK